jgi:hypothetical protein
MIIALGSSPDQSRQINHLLTGRSFGEGQAVDSGDCSNLEAKRFQR